MGRPRRHLRNPQAVGPVSPFGLGAVSLLGGGAFSSAAGAALGLGVHPYTTTLRTGEGSIHYSIHCNGYDGPDVHPEP